MASSQSAHFTFFRRGCSFSSLSHRNCTAIRRISRRGEAAEPYLSPVGGSSRVRPTIFL